MPRPPVPLLLLTLSLCAAFALVWARPAAGAGRGLSSHGPAGAGHRQAPARSSSSSLSARARWRWPIHGAVARRFRLARDPFARGQHRGVTLAASPVSSVLAPCRGPVRFAGVVGANGRTVTLGCGPLNATLTHLGSVLVQRGAVVASGQVVGRVGASGVVQLGARIRARRSGYLDPLTLLTADPAPPLGPAPPSGRLPSSPRAPSRPRPQAAPAPAGLPVGSLWLPAGLGLLGAVVLSGATRSLGPALGRAWRRRRHGRRAAPISTT